jgi:hypothetical protein
MVLNLLKNSKKKISAGYPVTKSPDLGPKIFFWLKLLPGTTIEKKIKKP